jgi:hypothetical protein
MADIAFPCAAGGVVASSFGAKGDGVTDDTAALQAALNSLSAGQALILDAGTYLVSNLVLPAVNNAQMIGRGKPTIKKKSGGDNSYLVASYNWVNNVTNAQPPFDVRDVIFDGASIAATALMWQSWNSNLERLEITGATSHGMVATAVTKNGTTISGTVVNIRYSGCIFHDNGGSGFKTNDPNRNQITDEMMDRCFAYSNGGYGTQFQGSAGLIMRGCHMYGNTSGSASFDLFDYGTIIADNHFEDDVHLLTPYDNIGRIGPGNIFKSKLCMDFGPSGSKLVIVSFGNQFYLSTGQISHTYFGSNCYGYSVGDHFETSTPFAFSNGSSPGTIIAKSCYSLGADLDLDGVVTVSNLLPKAVANLTTVPSAAGSTGDVARNKAAAPFAPSRFVYNGAWYATDRLMPTWSVPVRKTTAAAAATSTSISYTFTLDPGQSANHGSLSVDVSASVLSGSFNTMDVATAKVVFSAARKFNAATSAVKASVAYSNASANITFGTPTISSDGSTGAQTITCTIVVNHPTPSGTDSVIITDARLEGRGATALA